MKRLPIVYGLMLIQISVVPFCGSLYAQSLEDILNEKLEAKGDTDFTFATFKAGRIINGHSIESTEKGDLQFIVAHRFGTLNSGFYNFFGLDEATTRLGLDYGITDRINVGIGRSTYQKTWDGFLKLKILRQGTGPKTFPFTLSLLLGSDLNTFKDPAAENEYSFANRLSYVTQLLAARKFGPRLSLQISPTYIHKNLVPRKIDQNNIFALGAGGRYKLGNRVSLNAEYFYLLPGQSADDYRNSFSIGVDLETGGHVFQLHLTNSRSMIERGFITETTGNWLEGDIHFGFNLTRNFGLQRIYQD
jgi:hypothetical protein